MKKLIAVLAVATMLLSLCAFASADVLYWATNPEYPPFEYVENDVVTGYDADLINAIAAKIGYEKAEPAIMQFAAVVSEVQANPEKYPGKTVAEESMLTPDTLTWTLGATVGIKFSKEFAIHKQAQKVKTVTAADEEDEEPEQPVTPSGGGDNTGGDNTGGGTTPPGDDDDSGVIS